MIHLSLEFIKTIACGFGLIIATLGGAIGQATIFKGASLAANRQQKGAEKIGQFNTMGLFIVEGGVILSLLMILYLWTTKTEKEPLLLIQISSAIILGITSFLCSFCSGKTVRNALNALGRNPYSENKLTTLLPLTQSLCELPLIFTLLLIFFAQRAAIETFYDSTRILAGLFALICGASSSAIGQGLLTQKGMDAFGINPHFSSSLMKQMLFFSTLIEAPFLFTFIFSIKIFTQAPLIHPVSWLHGILFFGPALALGIGSIMPTIAIASVAAQSIYSSALAPESINEISKTSLFVQMIIEMCSIYGIVIAFIILGKFF